MDRASMLREYVRSPDGKKKLRYAAVSLAFVPIGQILLQIFVLGVFHGRDGGGIDVAANLMVATLLTPPYFYANKRIVWVHESREGLHRQVIAFWILSMVSVMFSSASLFVAAELFPTANPTLRGVRILTASLGGAAVVWVSRYVILDRWMFGRSTPGVGGDDEGVDEPQPVAG